MVHILDSIPLIPLLHHVHCKYVWEHAPLDAQKVTRRYMYCLETPPLRMVSCIRSRDGAGKKQSKGPSYSYIHDFVFLIHYSNLIN